MNNSKIYTERVARDQMIALLEIGVPYPAADIPVSYKEKVAIQNTSTISLCPSQPEITYDLYEEHGDTSEGSVTGNWGQVELITPEITEDVSFLIKACRSYKLADQPKSLCVYLHEVIRIKSGIDLSLPVSFEAESQVKARIIDHNTQISEVFVHGSQEGISYEVVLPKGINRNTDTKLCNSVKGNKNTIKLELKKTKNKFTEDTTLYIRAFRTSDENDVGYLSQTLQVQVRPDPTVSFSLVAGPIDYKGSPAITFDGPVPIQQSVNYELYYLPLPPSYSYEADTAVYASDGNELDAIFRSKLIDLDRSPVPRLAGEIVVNDQNKVTIPVIPLEEDQLLLVKATNKKNGESVFLEQHLIALVYPDTQNPKLNLEEGEHGKINLFIEYPQRRTGYQLRETGGKEIGPVMLPPQDTGVGWRAHEKSFGMRLSGTPGKNTDDQALENLPGDFRIAAKGQSKAKLFPEEEIAFVPFSPDTGKEYEVLAIKEYTGLTATLTQKISWNNKKWEVVDIDTPE